MNYQSACFADHLNVAPLPDPAARHIAIETELTLSNMAEGMRLVF